MEVREHHMDQNQMLVSYCRVFLYVLSCRHSIIITNICYSQQSATCFVSSNGLKVTVEDAKCVQANAFVQSGIFQEYIFKEDSATFRINLNILLVIDYNFTNLWSENK